MKNNKSSFIKNIKKFWPYVKECKKNLIFYVIIAIIEAIIGAVLPLVGAKVILNISNGIMDQLILSALTVLIIKMILYVIVYFKIFFYQKVYHKASINSQIAVAKETLKLQINEIDKASSGVFIERLNKDTQDISGIFMDYTYYLSYILSNIGILFTIFVLNKYLFIYAIITAVGVFLINKKRLDVHYDIKKKLKKLQDKKTGLTGELVRGIRDIKVLNASKTVLNLTTNNIRGTVDEESNMIYTKNIYSYFTSNIRSIFDFLFIVLGCCLYNKSLITIPVFIIVYEYQFKIQELLRSVIYIIETNKRFVLASDRVFEIIEGNKFKKEVFGIKKVKKLTGNISFKDVEFGYDDNKKIINKMSFDIKANEKIGFVGKSGVGKTTIFNLITKLYNVDSGEILFDGYGIDDLDCNSLRDNMSIITQNPYIFNFSIKDNLLLAKEKASMKEIRNACKLACIDDYIMSLPEKYDTMVGENGVILSGGQKQRLAIARALLMKTEIILFDEATSALDNETQSEIQKAIDNLKGEYTILIIAHRLSTIVDCDKIFVVDDGKIIDSGSHKELLKRCDFYKILYEKDLNV